MNSPQPFRPIADGIILVLRVTPNAGVDRIEGVEVRADGQAVLRVRVAAVPDRGRANAAVIALIAEALGVARRDVSVLTGETARSKSLKIVGDTGDLAQRLGPLLVPAK